MYGTPIRNANKSSRFGAGKPYKDKRRYSRSAGLTNGVNLRAAPMRGGIRL